MTLATISSFDRYASSVMKPLAMRTGDLHHAVCGDEDVRR